MDIRERIRWAIDQKPELTVRNVSLEAGLSDSALHKFLTSQTSDLKLGTVNKLAEALSVDPIWLAYGEGDPEPASDVAGIWSKIPSQDRPTALRILEGLARTGTDG